MDKVYITLHDGAGEPDKKWTNGIHRFLEESGATVDPATSEQIGAEVLSKLKPKLDSGQLEEPEFAMALLEAVMPLCPGAEAPTTAAIRITSKIVASLTAAIQTLAADMRAGVPLEKLRVSAMNLDKLINQAKAKMPGVAESLREKNAAMQAKKNEAMALLTQLESSNILAERGKAGIAGVVDERFKDVNEIVAAYNEMRAASPDEEEGDEEEGAKEISLNGTSIGKDSIEKSWAAERAKRQLLAAQLYITKTEMSTIKSAAISVTKVSTIFSRMPTMQIERGVQSQGVFDHIENFLSHKMNLVSENLADRARELKEIMSTLSDLYAFKSFSHEEMRDKNLPMAKLLEMLPNNDWFFQNYSRLMDLEEIYQNSTGKRNDPLSNKQTQQAKASDVNSSQISFEQFAKSFPGVDLNKALTPEQKDKVESLFSEINKQPGMTWKKGMAISLFNDPPSPATAQMLKSLTTESGEYGQSKLVGESVDINKPVEQIGKSKEQIQKEKKKNADDIKAIKRNLKDRPDSSRRKEWEEQLQKLEEQKNEIVKQISTGADTYNKAGARLGRKLFELNRENPHWMVFFDAIRPYYVNRKTVTEDVNARRQAEEVKQKIEAARSAMQSGSANPNTKAAVTKNMNSLLTTFEELQAGKVEGVRGLNSKELVMAAIDNDKAPSWILMRAVQFPLDRQTADLAEHNLEERGWTPQLDKSGELVEDADGNYVWNRTAKAESKPKAPKKAPMTQEKAPKKAPKAPEKKPAKPKKSSALSIREKRAQDMSRNLDQQVDTAKKMAEDAAAQQKLLEQQRQMKINAPNTPSSTIAPAAPAALSPSGTPMQAAPPTGVNNVGVKTFSAKDRLSKRG